MNSKFALVEIHEGFDNRKPMLPWRILEMYHCFDGMRTRVCQDAYSSKEQALFVLNEYWQSKGVDVCQDEGCPNSDNIHVCVTK